MSKMHMNTQIDIMTIKLNSDNAQNAHEHILMYSIDIWMIGSNVDRVQKAYEHTHVCLNNQIE